MQEETVATLDIGTTKIVVTIVRREISSSGEVRCEVIGMGKEPFNSIKHGMMVNIETTSEIIKKAVERAELMAGERITSLLANISSLPTVGKQSKGIIAISGGGERKDTREVSVEDIMRAIEMAESISVRSDKVILHSIPCEFTVDSLKVEEPLGASGVRLEVDVYLVLCHHAALENLEKVVSLANLSIKDVTLQSLASAEAVLSEEEKKAGALVLDIGGTTTDIVAYREDSVWFTDAIEIGSHHITKDMAYGLRTSLPQAEEIKCKYGFAKESLASEHEFVTIPLLSYKKTSRISKKAIAQIIEARAVEILTLCKETVEKENFLRNLESGIVITGGGALLSGIIELAEEIFEMPARMGEPINTVGIEDEIHHPSYTTSVGLAKLHFLKRPMEKRVGKNNERPEKNKSLSGLKKYIKNFFN